MFALAELLKFQHLPVAGGLYDQHPQLLAEWLVIWDEKAKYNKKKDEEERRKRESKMGSKAPRRR